MPKSYTRKHIRKYGHPASGKTNKQRLAWIKDHPIKRKKR